jgi:D-3-phosphoglycerate dehydrogenase
MRRPGAERIDRNDFMGHDAIGRTIGIIGLGNVGTRVAELCRLLFRMRVLAYDPYLTAEQVAARGAEKMELGALLAQADFVSLNCPRNRETLGLMGAAQFAAMRPNAYFITTARGGIHDEAALADALRERRLAGAGLDVWAHEPPAHDHPLMGFDTVILSPHTAGVTVEARVNMATIAAEQLLGVLDGRRPPRLLNPEAWPAFAARFERILGFKPQS